MVRVGGEGGGGRLRRKYNQQFKGIQKAQLLADSLVALALAHFESF